MNEFAKFEHNHWLNRVINTTVKVAVRKESKRIEQKIYREGGHSWACKSEVTVSTENTIWIQRFFWQCKKTAWTIRIKNVKQICLQEYDSPAVPKSRLHIFFVLRACHQSVVSQFVNSEAKESSGAAGSDFVVLCCHLCFGFASLQHFNSVSSYSLVELESFGL